VIIGIGTDIVSVQRIAALLAQRGDRFLERWFTRDELAYCLSQGHPSQHLAARLAAKEAVFKALRLSGDRYVPWREIEVSHDDVGAPVVALCGELARTAKHGGVAEVLITMAHTDDNATATALVLRS
jgi:holo-[acyl-carrier protein] synthase